MFRFRLNIEHSDKVDIFTGIILIIIGMTLNQECSGKNPGFMRPPGCPKFILLDFGSKNILLDEPIKQLEVWKNVFNEL